ncbi:MAG TPA: SDR family oxidoreductase [Candidatus Polarisedimenticolia bacterium]|nr:SDR family oxidoreductase [Candidatus Polarisedimenticolia bacterium]
MDLGIQGKIAIVCGASAGLGKATAAALAREGARVAICSRSLARVEAAAREIESTTGGKILPFAADVTDGKALDAMLEKLRGQWGAPDILVNNSGGPPPGNFQDTPESAWEPAYRLTLEAPVALCRKVLAGMKEKRWGRIVTITSLTVKQPAENLLLSNTYRTGLTAFLKTLAGEVAPFGITVNCVCPGYTETERLDELAENLAAKRGVMPAQVREEWKKAIPVGRLGKPEEIGDLIAYLASDKAGYITGVSILADGGHIRALV